LARPIVLISHLFWLAGTVIFRKDYSPSSSPPSRPTGSHMSSTLMFFSPRMEPKVNRGQPPRRAGHLRCLLRREDHARQGFLCRTSRVGRGGAPATPALPGQTTRATSGARRTDAKEGPRARAVRSSVTALGGSWIWGGALPGRAVGECVRCGRRSSEGERDAWGING
jgi:hypothetical protein